MGKIKNLSDRIPVYKIEKGVAVGRTTATSCIMELSMPQAYGICAEEINGYYELFNRVVKAVPSGYILHKQDYYNRRTYVRDKTKVTFLSRGYEAKFHGRQFLDHRSYLIICRYPFADNFVNNLMTALTTGRLVRKEVVEGMETFGNTVLKIQHLLKGGGLGARLLDNEEIKRLLNRYFNFGNPRILGDIVFGHDQVRIGNDELVVYSPVSSGVELPGELDSEANSDEFFDRSFTFPLGIGLQVPHIVNTVIRKNDTGRLVKLLSAKREKISSLSFRNLRNRELVGEYDAFLKEQVRGGQTPVHLSQNVMLWGRGEELLRAENELNNALTKMDFFVQRNINCANVYWACTPGGIADMPESEYQVQFSDTACMYIPVETNPKDTGLNGGIKLSERDYGIPVTVDLWDAPMRSGQITNRNMFVLGPSGSGKSFFTNFMVRQLMEQGYHVTIIDVGGSYRRQCRYWKGKYFEYTKENKMSFNPFFVEEGEEKNIEEQESLKTLIFTIWKGEARAVGQEEYTILGRCITGYYGYLQESRDDRKDGENGAGEIPACFNTFYEYTLDVFAKSLSEEEQKYFNTESFRIVFSPYYEGGEHDYLLNSAEEFTIARLPFCVFELDEIKDNKSIFPIVALIIMETFISKMRRRKEVRKIILIEEAWKAISSPAMAGFLKYLYKTVRKFNGAVGIITQEIEDIVGNEFVKGTILNNADIQILLDQTKYKNRFGDISKLLGLQSSEIKKVMSINKKPRAGDRFNDVYIRLGSIGIVYSVLVSPVEAAMYTTEASESVAIDRMADEEGDLNYAVDKYVHEKKRKKIA